MITVRNIMTDYDPYIRPNSFISYLNNILAIIIFYFLKKIKWFTPNIITTISLVLWIIAVYGFFFHSWKLLFVFVAGISYTFDNVDGIWARYFNQMSKFGAWYDSTSDRAKDLVMISTLSYYFKNSYLFIPLCMLLSTYVLSLFFILRKQIKRFPLNQKKFSCSVEYKRRFIAFGPAEALILYSLVILLPISLKWVPVLVFFPVIIYTIIDSD